MSVILECIGCRQPREFDKEIPYPVCPACQAWDEEHREKMYRETYGCSRCGYVGRAVEDHHIYGRKNSPETIKLCANCHRELHRGVWEYV